MSVMVSSDFVCFDEAVLDLPDLPLVRCSKSPVGKMLS